VCRKCSFATNWEYDLLLRGAAVPVTLAGRRSNVTGRSRRCGSSRSPDVFIKAQHLTFGNSGLRDQDFVGMGEHDRRLNLDVLIGSTAHFVLYSHTRSYSLSKHEPRRFCLRLSGSQLLEAHEEAGGRSRCGV